jgi:hypothetical protein
VRLLAKTQGRGEQVPKIPKNFLVIENYRFFFAGGGNTTIGEARAL